MIHVWTCSGLLWESMGYNVSLGGFTLICFCLSVIKQIMDIEKTSAVIHATIKIITYKGKELLIQKRRCETARHVVPLNHVHMVSQVSGNII